MINKDNNKDNNEAILLKQALQSDDNTRNFTMMDFTPNSSRMLDQINTFAKTASEVDTKTYAKYKKYGIEWDADRFNAGLLDIELARRQSNWEKLGHALEQTVVNEIVLGTALGYSDLFDIVVGEVFKGDNDYQNPVSVYLENLQNQFKENHDIYQDPTKTGWNDWSDFGWWMNNIPSIMSALTLLIPGVGVGKAVSFAGRLAGKSLRKTVAFTRKAANASKHARMIEDMPKIGKVENWLNRPNVGTLSNRILENGTTALAMRTMENYQESRQVYNDMMGDVEEYLNNANDKEKAAFLERNKELFEKNNIDINNNKEMAKAVAKEAADRTFIIDYSNLLFDVIQVSALRNPLKLTKSLRATAKVNKAQREAKFLAKFKTVEEGEKALSNRSKKQKTLDWLSDRAKAGWIIASETTESVEEAVNYIAQQEGINYGNLMLDPERANIHTAEKWRDYLTSSELYESAFWGFLGGVVFQGGGSKLKRVHRATVNTISKNRKFNEETLEGNETGTKTTWKREYNLAEDALRAEEINSRYSNLTELKKRRDKIYNEGISPFEDDSLEPGKFRKLETQLEKDLAWQRAVDDFIVNQTFKAIDAGNYDLLKEYLTNPDVIRHIEEIALDENNPAPKIDVNTLVAKMDEVEKVYTDNLISVNGFCGDLENVPFEYVNIIARSNTIAEIKAQHIQKKIDGYEQSAEANEIRFGESLKDVFGEPSLDYKAAVSLITAVNYLKELRAAKQEILSDNKTQGSLNGQLLLNSIDSKIDVLTKYIADLKPVLTNVQTNENLLGVINTLFATQSSLPENSDEEFDFRRAIAVRDIATLSKISGREFKLTDDDIIKVFGEEGTTTGVFYGLSNELVSHFGVNTASNEKVSKFVEAAPNLADDYSVIAALNVSKLLEEANIANTKKSVENRIQTLHNSMNKARALAVKTSRDTLVKQAKKYGRDKLMDYVFNNVPLTDVSEEDKKLIDDALTILNLTNPNNAQLANIIRTNILLGDYEKSVDEAEEKKNSSTSQKQTGNEKSPKMDNNIKPKPKPSREAKTDLNGENNVDNLQNSEELNQNQNIRVTPDIDKGTSFSFVGIAEDDSIPFKETKVGDNDGYELFINSSDKLSRDEKDNLVKNSDLFDGYDSTNKNSYKITKNPILVKNDDGSIDVYEKGIIEYKKDTSAKASSENTNVSPKGDEEYNSEDYSSYNDEEGDDYRDGSEFSDDEYEREHQKLIEANRINDLIIKLKDDCFELADKLKDENQSQEEIYNAIKEKIDKFREEAGNTDAYEANIEAILTLVNMKFDLLGVAKAVNDVRSSTLVEKKEGKYTQGFINKVYALIEEYAKAAKIKKANNDKYFINFEDFIRNINNLYNGIYEGEAIYNKMKNFLLSEYNTQVVITDNINDPDLLDNARKPVEVRLRERIGKRDNYRVGIDEFFENPTSEFLKVFDSLKIGDKVGIKREGKRIYITKRNTQIGVLAVPDHTPDGDGYIITNKGWETEVYDEASGRVSPLRQVFSKLADDDDVNNIIAALLYNDLSDEQRRNLIEEAFNLIQPKSNGLLLPNAKKKDAIDFISNIWRYKMSAVDFSKPSAERSLRIDNFIDIFFQKLYDSYDAIYKLSQEKKKNVEVEIAHINDGELIRVVDEKDIDLKVRRQSRNNYDKFTQSNQAFKNHKDCKIGIVTKQNTLTLEKNQEQTHTRLGVEGTIHVVIPNRSGINQFCIATSVVTTDRNIENSDAEKIIKASRNYLNDAIDAFIQNQSDKNYKALSVIISDLMRHDSTNASVFAGVGVKIDPKGTITLTSGNKKLTIYRKTASSERDFIYNDGKKGSKAVEYSYQDDGTTLKEALNSFFDNCFFNADFKFVNNKWSIQNNSTIGYKDNGKFVIRIGKYFNKTYDNLSQAFIQGGLIRVNTKLEDGSNYRRKGQKQGGSQILEISLNTKTTSPVKENESVEQQPKQEQIVEAKQERTGEDIFDTEDANDVVDELVKNALPKLDKNNEKELKDLELLPKSIIFAEELTDKDGTPAVAQTNFTTNEMKVSRLFLNMYDGVGEYSKDKDFYRKQAVRKLIHEQVHVRIREQGRDNILKQIQSIYDEFEQYVNSLDDENKKRYYGFLFKDKTDNNERLEEFLVESFTAINLANKLNEIETTYKEGELDETKAKETLWDKILKLIAKIFNYNIYKTKEDGTREIDINKQSLLQKELYALAGAINSQGETITEETIDELSDELSDDIDLDGDTIESTLIENVIPTEERNKILAIEREMQDIKAKAIADGTFMKAPNGKPTNLTERQWLQVRTQNFIKWFGIWNKNPFAENVSIDDGTFNPDNADMLGYRPEFIFRQNGEYIGSFHFEELIRNRNGELENNTPYLTFPEVGQGLSIEPEFRGKGLGKAMYYEAAKYAARKGKTLRSASLDRISESARRIWKSFETIGIAELKDNHYIYLNGTLNYSKVVDENGEPLVVYHGGINDINIFDLNKNRSKVSWFTTDKSYAKKYAIKNNSDKIYEVFLNIRNPYGGLNDLEALDDLHTSMINFYKEAAGFNTLSPDGYIGHDTFSETKSSKGYEIAITNPNQIKSASDNVGTFSREDNDIRHSTLIETSPVYNSTSSFIQSFKPENQPDIARRIQAGEISIVCK